MKQNRVPNLWIITGEVGLYAGDVGEYATKKMVRRRKSHSIITVTARVYLDWSVNTLGLSENTLFIEWSGCELMILVKRKLNETHPDSSGCKPNRRKTKTNDENSPEGGTNRINHTGEVGEYAGLVGL